MVSPPKEKKKKVELAVDTGPKPAGDDLTSSEVELMESGELTVQRQRRRGGRFLLNSSWCLTQEVVIPREVPKAPTKPQSMPEAPTVVAPK